MIRFTSCVKTYSLDQDKHLPPEETLAKVKKRLASLPFQILAETRRIDSGRLGIPVFISLCGKDAATVMPTHKQMGKGATPAQAEASAVMELMERFAFFSFWENPAEATKATWDEAEALFQEELMPLEEIILACNDSISLENARRIMNTRSWAFFPVTDMHGKKTVRAPLELFRLLNEFNGSSAGNTDMESILQGACELVERHVCALALESLEPRPGIDPASLDEPVLRGLYEAFSRTGVSLVLKDFSLDMPIPTVAALAYDPLTLGKTSEIVFTAGTASSPVKAAVRALTEVAQLAGDFCTSSCYEPSGLPKYERLSEAAWLLSGPLVPLNSLPSIEDNDIAVELQRLVSGLRRRPETGNGYGLYSVGTTHPLTGIPSHYSFIPGFHFRERAKNASLGLFTGRLLAETEPADVSLSGLRVLEQIQPEAHYLPFFYGLVSLRQGLLEQARHSFSQAAPLQPDDEHKAMALFYHGYCHTLEAAWQKALPHLEEAAALCPDQKEYRNLYGVCLFKGGQYAAAAKEFSVITTRLDKGSSLDLQNLGLCHKHLGHIEEARRCLHAALEIDPSLEAAAAHLRELDSPERA